MSRRRIRGSSKSARHQTAAQVQQSNGAYNEISRDWESYYDIRALQGVGPMIIPGTEVVQEAIIGDKDNIHDQTKLLLTSRGVGIQYPGNDGIITLKPTHGPPSNSLSPLPYAPRAITTSFSNQTPYRELGCSWSTPILPSDGDKDLQYGEIHPIVTACWVALQASPYYNPILQSLVPMCMGTSKDSWSGPIAPLQRKEEPNQFALQLDDEDEDFGANFKFIDPSASQLDNGDSYVVVHAKLLLLDIEHNAHYFVGLSPTLLAEFVDLSRKGLQLIARGAHRGGARAATHILNSLQQLQKLKRQKGKSRLAALMRLQRDIPVRSRYLARFIVDIDQEDPPLGVKPRPMDNAAALGLFLSHLGIENLPVVEISPAFYSTSCVSLPWSQGTLAGGISPSVRPGAVLQLLHWTDLASIFTGITTAAIQAHLDSVDPLQWIQATLLSVYYGAYPRTAEITKEDQSTAITQNEEFISTNHQPLHQFLQHTADLEDCSPPLLANPADSFTVTSPPQRVKTTARSALPFFTNPSRLLTPEKVDEANMTLTVLRSHGLTPALYSDELGLLTDLHTLRIRAFIAFASQHFDSNSSSFTAHAIQLFQTYFTVKALYCDTKPLSYSYLSGNPDERWSREADKSMIVWDPNRRCCRIFSTENNDVNYNKLIEYQQKPIETFLPPNAYITQSIQDDKTKTIRPKTHEFSDDDEDDVVSVTSTGQPMDTPPQISKKKHVMNDEAEIFVAPLQLEEPFRTLVMRGQGPFPHDQGPIACFGRALVMPDTVADLPAFHPRDAKAFRKFSGSDPDPALVSPAQDDFIVVQYLIPAEDLYMCLPLLTQGNLRVTSSEYNVLESSYSPAALEAHSAQREHWLRLKDASSIYGSRTRTARCFNQFLTMHNESMVKHGLGDFIYASNPLYKTAVCLDELSESLLNAKESLGGFADNSEYTHEPLHLGRAPDDPSRRCDEQYTAALITRPVAAQGLLTKVKYESTRDPSAILSAIDTLLCLCHDSPDSSDTENAGWQEKATQAETAHTTNLVGSKKVENRIRTTDIDQDTDAPSVDSSPASDNAAFAGESNIREQSQCYDTLSNHNNHYKTDRLHDIKDEEFSGKYFHTADVFYTQKPELDSSSLANMYNEILPSCESRVVYPKNNSNSNNSIMNNQYLNNTILNLQDLEDNEKNINYNHQEYISDNILFSPHSDSINSTSSPRKRGIVESQNTKRNRNFVEIQSPILSNFNETNIENLSYTNNIDLHAINIKKNEHLSKDSISSSSNIDESNIKIFNDNMKSVENSKINNDVSENISDLKLNINESDNFTSKQDIRNIFHIGQEPIESEISKNLFNKTEPIDIYNNTTNSNMILSSNETNKLNTEMDSKHYDIFYESRNILNSDDNELDLNNSNSKNLFNIIDNIENLSQDEKDSYHNVLKTPKRRLTELRREKKNESEYLKDSTNISIKKKNSSEKRGRKSLQELKLMKESVLDDTNEGFNCNDKNTPLNGSAGKIGRGRGRKAKGLQENTSTNKPKKIKPKLGDTNINNDEKKSKSRDSLQSNKKSDPLSVSYTTCMSPFYLPRYIPDVPSDILRIVRKLCQLDAFINAHLSEQLHLPAMPLDVVEKLEAVQSLVPVVRATLGALRVKFPLSKFQNSLRNALSHYTTSLYAPTNYLLLFHLSDPGKSKFAFTTSFQYTTSEYPEKLGEVSTGIPGGPCHHCGYDGTVPIFASSNIKDIRSNKQLRIARLLSRTGLKQKSNYLKKIKHVQKTCSITSKESITSYKNISLLNDKENKYIKNTLSYPKKQKLHFNDILCFKRDINSFINEESYPINSLNSKQYHLNNVKNFSQKFSKTNTLWKSKILPSKWLNYKKDKKMIFSTLTTNIKERALARKVGNTTITFKTYPKLNSSHDNIIFAGKVNKTDKNISKDKRDVLNMYKSDTYVTRLPIPNSNNPVFPAGTCAYCGTMPRLKDDPPILTVKVLSMPLRLTIGSIQVAEKCPHPDSIEGQRLLQSVLQGLLLEVEAAEPPGPSELIVEHRKSLLLLLLPGITDLTPALDAIDMNYTQAPPTQLTYESVSCAKSMLKGLLRLSAAGIPLYTRDPNTGALELDTLLRHSDVFETTLEEVAQIECVTDDANIDPLFPTGVRDGIEVVYYDSTNESQQNMFIYPDQNKKYNESNQFYMDDINGMNFCEFSKDSLYSSNSILDTISLKSMKRSKSCKTSKFLSDDSVMNTEQIDSNLLLEISENLSSTVRHIKADSIKKKDMSKVYKKKTLKSISRNIRSNTDFELSNLQTISTTEHNKYNISTGNEHFNHISTLNKNLTNKSKSIIYNENLKQCMKYKKCFMNNKKRSVTYHGGKICNRPNRKTHLYGTKTVFASKENKQQHSQNNVLINISNPDPAAKQLYAPSAYCNTRFNRRHSNSVAVVGERILRLLRSMPWETDSWIHPWKPGTSSDPLQHMLERNEQLVSSTAARLEMALLNGTENELELEAKLLRSQPLEYTQEEHELDELKEAMISRHESLCVGTAEASKPCRRGRRPKYAAVYNSGEVVLSQGQTDYVLKHTDDWPDYQKYDSNSSVDIENRTMENDITTNNDNTIFAGSSSYQTSTPSSVFLDSPFKIHPSTTTSYSNHSDQVAPNWVAHPEESEPITQAPVENIEKSTDMVKRLKFIHRKVEHNSTVDTVWYIFGEQHIKRFKTDILKLEIYPSDNYN